MLGEFIGGFIGLAVIVIIIVLVSAVQAAGSWIVKKTTH